MTYAELQARAKRSGLQLLGGFANDGDPHLPQSCRSLILLGPQPDFWSYFNASPEWLDGAPDPVDRWSTRVVSALATEAGGDALFPFGGPPYLPFFTWALRSGQAWQSPVNLLIHSDAGLMVSYRGALALPYEVAFPPPKRKPCETCEQPCLTACRPRALTAQGYDVPACKDFLGTVEGRENLETGCTVRRTCPVSMRYARMVEQSAYHMRIFLGESR